MPEHEHTTLELMELERNAFVDGRANAFEKALEMLQSDDDDDVDDLESSNRAFLKERIDEEDQTPVLVDTLEVLLDPTGPLCEYRDGEYGPYGLIVNVSEELPQHPMSQIEIVIDEVVDYEHNAR